MSTSKLNSYCFKEHRLTTIFFNKTISSYLAMPALIQRHTDTHSVNMGAIAVTTITKGQRKQYEYVCSLPGYFLPRCNRSNDIL